MWKALIYATQRLNRNFRPPPLQDSPYPYSYPSIRRDMEKNIVFKFGHDYRLMTLSIVAGHLH